MNDRKRISLILAVMVLTTICFLALFFKYITPQYRWSYDRAVVDKVDRANKMGHPKLLFVGNSATAFGYRCMTIEEALDYEYYLANLGMHGSLGNSFHENMAKDALEEGDIVILCHTDYQGETWPAENCMYDWIAIENDFNIWDLVPKESWWGMVDAFPYYAKKCVRAWHTQTGNQIPAFGYSRADFNEYGDDVYCDGIAGYYQPETEELAQTVKFDEEGIKRVNEFNAYVESKGATLLIVCPPIMTTDINQDTTELVSEWNSFTDALDCQCITNIEDYLFSNEYFYDGALHVNSEGAALRSELFIRDFKNYLKAQ